MYDTCSVDLQYEIHVWVPFGIKMPQAHSAKCGALASDDCLGWSNTARLQEEFIISNACWVLAVLGFKH